MPSLRILNFAGFVAFLELIDKDTGGLRASDALLEGDVGKAWRILRQSATQLLTDQVKRKMFVTTLVTLGIAEMVVSGFSFRKSFTVGNFTVGI